jgi:hypothetical protein
MKENYKIKIPPHEQWLIRHVGSSKKSIPKSHESTES